MTNVIKNSIKKQTVLKKTVRKPLDNRKLMMMAHSLAKTFEGDYMARMSIALKIVWQQVKTPEVLPGAKLVASYRIIKNDTGTPIGETIEYENDGRMWTMKLEAPIKVGSTYDKPRTGTSRYLPHLCRKRQDDFKNHMKYLHRQLFRCSKAIDKGNPFAALKVDGIKDSMRTTLERIEIASRWKPQHNTTGGILRNDLVLNRSVNIFNAMMGEVQLETLID